MKSTMLNPHIWKKGSPEDYSLLAIINAVIVEMGMANSLVVALIYKMPSLFQNPTSGGHGTLKIRP
jgi:hypothetical protein